jgi:hypothetical protein
MSKRRPSGSRPSSKKTSARAGTARLRRKTAKRSTQRMPVKILRGKRRKSDREEGPAEWFLAEIESTYTRLESPAQAAARAVVPPAGVTRSGHAFRSALQPGEGEAVLAASDRGLWVDRLSEYKQRKSVAATTRAAAVPGAPAIPGARNWLPLGPTVVLEGQTVGGEPVGGRTVGLAVAAGGQRVYAASACGGVFRSDDGGTSWASMMDAFDIDPTNFASSSLACGAIAIDPADPDRVYVGTGEGETHEIFAARIVSALPAYRGIGPIRSDDGGATWVSEATAAGAPTLAGEAFFMLAVDPGNREHVVGATSAGLYHRVPQGAAFEWTRVRPGVHSSVVVAGAGGSRKFFAAEWGTGVVGSADGQTWTAAGTGFPTSDVGRITLGAQAGNGAVVYALVARNSNGTLHGVYRLDTASGKWKVVSGPPDVLPAPQGSSQGAYDLALAVDPADINRLYLGGSYTNTQPFPGSVWRADVKTSGAGFAFANARAIGTHAHADVHVLVHSPADPLELWCGCDGGVFLNRDPGGTGEFAGMNTGLSCLCSNFIAQHPTDPNILFTGLQDNGSARTPGGPMWTHVNSGDGGYCLINWADPNQVLTFANGTVYRSDTGGASENSWAASWDFPWATMTQPIVGTPFNPAQPADAKVVAVGAGATVFVSRDFARSWKQNDAMALPALSGENVFALAFASPARLFIGTTKGRVFRADRAGTTWTLTQIDNAPAGALGLTGLITDVSIDWADATSGSVYVTFGGMGDRRRVWHFDGTRWASRSGSPGNDLLDVEHNALAVDRAAPQHVYVGADIGVWHSSDSGATWTPLQNGLPDAPVFDLQIHPTQRLLRAATHGRGVYELALA